eukprot:CAMPEP_0114685234 /NCGR_PEP_ID=MMETSP0191-20121206/60205_1 /TAXON_ID=126664 /ORGANISM="Sorites sp." /LENGTH=38 /DNA_ID= /DNA_START= /DNA_END= /DNA_ORIENTATION=
MPYTFRMKPRLTSSVACFKDITSPPPSPSSVNGVAKVV